VRAKPKRRRKVGYEKGGRGEHLGDHEGGAGDNSSKRSCAAEDAPGTAPLGAGVGAASNGDNDGERVEAASRSTAMQLQPSRHGRSRKPSIWLGDTYV